MRQLRGAPRSWTLRTEDAARSLNASHHGGFLSSRSLGTQRDELVVDEPAAHEAGNGKLLLPFDLESGFRCRKAELLEVHELDVSLIRGKPPLLGADEDQLAGTLEQRSVPTQKRHDPPRRLYSDRAGGVLPISRVAR